MPSHSIPTAEILSATDLREPLRRALESVKRIAAARQAAVRVIHVIELTGGHPSFATEQASAERALRHIGHELRLAGLRQVATLIMAGRAAHAIRDALLRYQSGLLVLALPDGGRASPPPALGNKMRFLLRHAPCPVCTVTTHLRDSVSSPLTRLLTVTDLAPESLRAARQAWPAAPPDTKCHAILPAQEPTPPNPLSDPSPDPAPDPRNWPEAITFLSAANAASVILDDQQQFGAGLLVLSFAAGSYLDSFDTGTLAHHLIRSASCPVLTIRSSADHHTSHQ